MKFKNLIIALMVGTMFSSTLYADVKSGQKQYLKVLKSKFNMNGTKFAAEHTVEEWTELFLNDSAGFIKEYSEKFPSAKSTLENPSNKEKLKDIGDFVKEYGSDSGNVPSCG